MPAWLSLARGVRTSAAASISFELDRMGLGRSQPRAALDHEDPLGVRDRRRWRVQERGLARPRPPRVEDVLPQANRLHEQRRLSAKPGVLRRFGSDPGLLECSRHGAYDRTHSEVSRLDAGPRTPVPISPSPIDPRESRTMTCPPPCPVRWARPTIILAGLALALPAVPRVLGQAPAASQESPSSTAR